MARVSAQIELELPEDANVGDDFRISGDARIVMIRDHQIDVTSYGDPSFSKTVQGEREFELLVLNGRAVKIGSGVEAATAEPGELR